MHLDCNLGMAVICSIQSIIMATCFFKNGLINFSQAIIFGKIWWVVKMPMLEFVPDVFIAYHALCLINCIIVFSMMLVFVYNVPEVFKIKYINLMILQAVMFVLIVYTYVYNIPVWIHTLVMNFICYLTYYYIFIYSNLKLRDTVLYDFANELSDGVIIYNMYNDVIHINDRFKNIVSEEIINGIKNIDMMDRLISHTEKIGDFEVLPYSNDGKDYYFKIDRKTVGPDDDIIGTVYFFHDMSAEIDQMKLMKEMNSDLERNSLIKLDYLTFMSNKLLAPINRILNLSDAASEKNGLSADLAENFDQIRKSGINLKSIVNEMNDHFMLDNDSLEIINKVYNPLSEIHDVLNTIQGGIGDSETDYIFVIDPELPHELIGDNVRIRQVVINLSETMIKITGPGVVRIILSCRPISEDEIFIEFHLIGFGRDMKKFDPENNTEPRFSISKKLIEAMDGTFNVSNTKDKELDFSFSIPSKIADHKKDLVVENSSRKYAFCLNEKNMLNDEFQKEMKALGMDGKVITDLKEYKATGKTDYLFFISEYLSDDTLRFLDEHPMVIGIMLIGEESETIPSRPNLRYIRKPISTLSMVLSLNGMDFESLQKAGSDENI
ncbi:MAG: hypothetical protein J5696_08365 [Lachnospiraceae bacterium]|nr:hypothetical protein [Lachnospiraceae bacterium]